LSQTFENKLCEPSPVLSFNESNFQKLTRVLTWKYGKKQFLMFQLSFKPSHNKALFSRNNLDMF